jgi:betaine reductase
MVKEMERNGLPVVQIANLTPIAKTVGANRIVQSMSIPYPMGAPDKTREEEYAIRYGIVDKALRLLATDIPQQEIWK